VSTFLLLHGAWHGSWVWEPVIEGLKNAGHKTIAVDLPGLGTDAENLTPDINLETHIQAAMPLERSIVVAHSYAGMLARAIVERAFDLVEHVVLIEALWPENGQCVFDLVPPEAEKKLIETIQNEGNGWKIPPPSAKQFDIKDRSILELVSSNLTAHPAQTYADVLSLTQDNTMGTYIISNDRAIQPYESTVKRLSARAWQVEQIPGGHELMLTAVGPITNLLLNLNIDRSDHAT